MQWLLDVTGGCCSAPRHHPGLADTEGVASFTYRKETLSAADFHALSRSLREELDVPDVPTPTIGFLPSLSDVDRDLRLQEDRGDAFSTLVDYAVCGLLESRLHPNEAGLVFDCEERQLLVATASADTDVCYCRVPLEPSGITVENIKQIIQDKAREGLLFVSNTPSSITFEPALGVTLATGGDGHTTILQRGARISQRSGRLAMPGDKSCRKQERCRGLLKSPGSTSS